MRALLAAALADHRANPIILPTITLGRGDAIALLAVLDRAERLSHSTTSTAKG